MNEKTKQTAVVIPLRVPPAMREKIKKIAEKAGLSEADIMRLSIERGYEAVETMFHPKQKKAA